MKQRELRCYVCEAFRQMDGDVKHPSTLQIAEIAGMAPGAESGEVQSHVSACEQCQQVLKEFEQFQADYKLSSPQNLDQEWREFRQRIRWHRGMPASPRWGSIAAGIIIVFSLAWFGIKVFKPNGKVRTFPAQAVTVPPRTARGGSSESALLTSAKPPQGLSSPGAPLTHYNQRTLEFRLPDREYAPLRRGGDSGLGLSEAQLTAQTRHVQEIESRSHDPEILRIQGEVEIMAGHAAAATQILQKALNVRPQDPRVLSDLGIAYAVRGDIEGYLCAHIQPGQFLSPMCAQLERRPSRYSKALEYLNRSVDLLATPYAIFNRALVLERMLRKDEATLEWKRYLQMDSASGWAEEARHRPSNPHRIAGGHPKPE